MSETNTVHTLIVGGGHGGVNLACMLAADRPDVDYLVLERSSSLLSKWRESRWEGFLLNTPAKMRLLHGQTLGDGDDPWRLDGTLEDELAGWDAHIRKVGINYRLRSNVVEVCAAPDGTGMRVRVEESDPHREVMYEARNVVVCNGYYDKPTRPRALSDGIPPSIKQHSPAGLTFDALAEGNVLLVGSGQTGVQIADLLLRHRPDIRLYMATSAVPGCPRSFQGRELFDWLDEMKMLDMPREAIDAMPPERFDALRYGKAPVTGPTKDISPFSLHRRGVELLGRLEGIDTTGDEERKDERVIFRFQDDRASNLTVCLEGYRNFAKLIKAHAGQPEAPDAPEWSHIESELMDEPGRLEIDSVKDRITNVIWCTGWSHDFGFLSGIEGIDRDVDAKTKAPDVIVSKAMDGLFYCGFPWIGTLQSLNIVRFNHDAKIIVDNLREI